MDSLSFDLAFLILDGRSFHLLQLFELATLNKHWLRVARAHWARIGRMDAGSLARSPSWHCALDANKCVPCAPVERRHFARTVWFGPRAALARGTPLTFTELRAMLPAALYHAPLPVDRLEQWLDLESVSKRDALGVRYHWPMRIAATKRSRVGDALPIQRAVHLAPPDAEQRLAMLREKRYAKTLEDSVLILHTSALVSVSQWNLFVVHELFNTWTPTPLDTLWRAIDLCVPPFRTPNSNSFDWIVHRAIETGRVDVYEPLCERWPRSVALFKAVMSARNDQFAWHSLTSLHVAPNSPLRRELQRSMIILGKELSTFSHDHHDVNPRTSIWAINLLILYLADIIDFDVTKNSDLSEDEHHEVAWTVNCAGFIGSPRVKAISRDLWHVKFKWSPTTFTRPALLFERWRSDFVELQHVWADLVDVHCDDDGWQLDHASLANTLQSMWRAQFRLLHAMHRKELADHGESGVAKNFIDALCADEPFTGPSSDDLAKRTPHTAHAMRALRPLGRGAWSHPFIFLVWLRQMLERLVPAEQLAHERFGRPRLRTVLALDLDKELFEKEPFYKFAF